MIVASFILFVNLQTGKGKSRRGDETSWSPRVSVDLIMIIKVFIKHTVQKDHKNMQAPTHMSTQYTIYKANFHR